MLNSYSKKLIFVFLMALGIAFQAVPAMSMMSEEETWRQKLVESYYYKYPIDFIKASPPLNKNEHFKVEYEANNSSNPKAKVLLAFNTLKKGDTNISLSEWAEVHHWLSDQSDDPMALFWLGIFTRMGWEGHPSDSNMADQYFLTAAEKGDAKICGILADLFEDKFFDPEKAIKYYSLAIEKGDRSLYRKLAHMYESSFYGKKDWGKAEYFYKKHFQEVKSYYSYRSSDMYSLACIYRKGWEDHPAKPEKAVHYFTIASQDKDFKTQRINILSYLHKYCIPRVESQEDKLYSCLKKDCYRPHLWEEAKPVFAPFSEKEATEIETKWKTLLTCLENMDNRISWKHDTKELSLVIQNLEPLNTTSTEPVNNKHSHRKKFLTLFLDTYTHLSKVLEENAFCFMAPKKTVQEHLLKTFKVYNPSQPTDPEDVGLCLYKVDDKTLLTFGNENVKICHALMNILAGNSFVSLIDYHQKHTALLEKLRNQLQGPFDKADQESLQLLNQILAKPGPFINYTGEECFGEFLRTSFENKYNIGEEAVTNEFIDQCVREEITTYLHEKIERRHKKVETLQEVLLEIGTSFKDMLRITHPRKVAQFGKEYGSLDHMFE